MTRSGELYGPDACGSCLWAGCVSNQEPGTGDERERERGRWDETDDRVHAYRVRMKNEERRREKGEWEKGEGRRENQRREKGEGVYRLPTNNACASN